MSDFYEQGSMPVSARLDAYTDEGIETAGIVDELIEENDRVTNNILHAIHGTALGEIWDKDENGVYVKQEDATVVEAASYAVIEVFVGAIAIPEVEEPVGATITQLDEERARRRPPEMVLPAYTGAAAAR